MADDQYRYIQIKHLTFHLARDVVNECPKEREKDIVVLSTRKDPNAGPDYDDGLVGIVYKNPKGKILFRPRDGVDYYKDTFSIISWFMSLYQERTITITKKGLKKKGIGDD